MGGQGVWTRGCSESDSVTTFVSAVDVGDRFFNRRSLPSFRFLASLTKRASLGGAAGWVALRRAMLSRCTRVLHRVARRLPRRHLSTLAESSESVQEQFDPANPTAEHRALRKMVQEFTKNEVEPQALQYNREERFNRALFERAGELGLLGVTADPEYGGAGMDATAACIVHEVPYDAPSCHDAGPVA